MLEVTQYSKFKSLCTGSFNRKPFKRRPRASGLSKWYSLHNTAFTQSFFWRQIS